MLLIILGVFTMEN